MDENNIPAKDLFMMCESLEPGALSELPAGFHFRTCRRGELDVWKRIHFDTIEEQDGYYGFMTDYFDTVYAPKAQLFFDRCTFACDEDDIPVGTCFVWKAYDKISTIHWLKVVKKYEGCGIGRALLSHLMGGLREEDYPVYLHTHPSCFRAIKLYSDFGFCLVSDPVVGNRANDLKECLPILEGVMPGHDFRSLRIAKAPQIFLDSAASSEINEF